MLSYQKLTPKLDESKKPGIISNKKLFKKYPKGAAIEGRKTDFPLYATREVKNENQQVRYYPDEWLIVTALQKYLQLRQPVPGKKVIVLAEKWAGNGVPELGNSLISRKYVDDDEGGENTPEFSDVILKTIEEASQDPCETLILVPYLYDWHHPGLAIQVKGKSLIYLDPVGRPPKKPEVLALQKTLSSEKNFDIQFVTTPQQKGGTICGFVLTASMMKFIEEFLMNGKISVNGFEANKPNIHTAYMFQLYVNNWKVSGQALTNEIMIAEKDLWLAFLREQKLDSFQLTKNLVDWNSNLDTFLKTIFTTGSEEEIINIKKLDMINMLQSKIIELIFTRPDDMELQVKKLTQCGSQLLGAATEVEFDKNFDGIKDSLILLNLLSPPCIDNTKAILNLPASPMRELLQLSLFKKSSMVAKRVEDEIISQILTYAS